MYLLQLETILMAHRRLTHYSFAAILLALATIHLCAAADSPPLPVTLDVTFKLM